MEEDKQLQRLYDYTKFHIAIYLGFSSALLALIGKASDMDFLKSLINHPFALVISLALMVLAGVSGGIVATSTIESKTYEEFISKRQGAYGLNLFTGKTWVTLEHLCFWLSLSFLAFSILAKPSIWNYVSIA